MRAAGMPPMRTVGGARGDDIGGANPDARVFR